MVIAVFIPALQELEFWKKITRKKDVIPNPSQPINKVTILPLKINKIIDKIKQVVAKKNRLFKISNFMYSKQKNHTDRTILIKTIKNVIEKKSKKKLTSIILSIFLFKKKKKKNSSFLKKNKRQEKKKIKLQKILDK